MRNPKTSGNRFIWSLIPITSLCFLYGCDKIYLPNPPEICMPTFQQLEEGSISFLPSTTLSQLTFETSSGNSNFLKSIITTGYHGENEECETKTEVITIEYLWGDSTLFSTLYFGNSVKFFQSPITISKLYWESDIGQVYLQKRHHYYQSTPANGWDAEQVDTLNKQMVVFTSISELKATEKLKKIKYLQGIGPVEFTDANDIKWKLK